MSRFNLSNNYRKPQQAQPAAPTTPKTSMQPDLPVSPDVIRKQLAVQQMLARAERQAEMGEQRRNGAIEFNVMKKAMELARKRGASAIEDADLAKAQEFIQGRTGAPTQGRGTTGRSVETSSTTAGGPNDIRYGDVQTTGPNDMPNASRFARASQRAMEYRRNQQTPKTSDNTFDRNFQLMPGLNGLGGMPDTGGMIENQLLPPPKSFYESNYLDAYPNVYFPSGYGR